MKNIQLPVSLQQRQYEDMAQALIKSFANLHEEQQNSVFEMVMEYERENWQRTHPATKKA